MIYGSTAPTGGGKSYSACTFLFEYLRDRPNDHICTNLAVEMEELVAYCIRQTGWSCNAQQRIRILTESEVKRFWLHFGVGFDIPPSEKQVFVDEETGQQTLEVDYKRRGYLLDETTGERKGHSVLYILDESDEVFDSKHWAKISGDLKFYCRHQRKFGDNVYFLAPSWSFLCKDVRVLCHMLWIWENKQQEKFGRIPLIGRKFRGGNGIVGRMWKLEEGEKVGDMERDKMEFTIDPNGIGKCYRTEDGYGVKGIANRVRGAEKVKGWHPAWMMVIGLGVLLVGILLFEWIGSKIQNTIDSFAPKPALAKTQASVQPRPAPSFGISSQFSKEIAEIQKLLEVAKTQEAKKSLGDKLSAGTETDLRLTGVFQMGNGLEFWWSDGTKTSSGDRRFEKVLWTGLPGKSLVRGIVWDGQEFRL